jgi:sugar lactone lactonase YvrE
VRVSAQEIQVFPVPGPGAEDVVVATSGADEGAVYTGTEDGAVWRVSHDGQKVDHVADTGGRPLGIEIDLDGRLLVCDAHRGLLRIDPRTGAVEAVADSVAGTRMVFCNNAAIASDGTVWFSDSSTKYPIEQWKDDFVQDTCTGRLLRRDPDGTITSVLDGLAFANGVALAKDESYVAVAETGHRTVVRHWLTGAKAAATTWPRTCRATPTTSRAAATAWSGSRSPVPPTRWWSGSGAGRCGCARA